MRLTHDIRPNRQYTKQPPPRHTTVLVDELCRIVSFGSEPKNSHAPSHTVCQLVAEWLGCWTCDQQVPGSNPGRLDVDCNLVCLYHQTVLSTGASWESRSCVALVMRHRQTPYRQWYFHLRANCHEHPAYLWGRAHFTSLFSHTMR